MIFAPPAMTTMHACASVSGGAICPPPAIHKPVLLDKVLKAFTPHDGGVYVDGTFGAGGYSAAILEAADCTVWGIDRDPYAITTGTAMKDKFGDRLELITGCFGDMGSLLAKHGVTRVEGVTFDLGVSSMQLDQPERGFSFRFNGPLDMRMEGNDAAGPSAADIVNNMDEKELADIIYHYGSERRSLHVARAIVKARSESPIITPSNSLASSAVWCGKVATALIPLPVPSRPCVFTSMTRSGNWTAGWPLRNGF